MNRLLYPIAWGVSEGGNKISMDSEQAFYCTLDVLSQGAFAVALLYLTRRLDFDAHRLGFSEYGRLHDPVHGEKHHHRGVTGAHNGGTAGTVPATTV